MHDYICIIPFKTPNMRLASQLLCSRGNSRPCYDGTDAEIKSVNDKRLAECDAVILCWASASEVWVAAQANALRNWHELGRTQQFSYRAVVAAPPAGQ